MNEWQLQKSLTSRWLEDGVRVGRQRYFLLAWEVMVPSWRINDASTYWAEPSIDFLVADEDGQLAAIELKTSIHGVKPVWRALCQVTHRAIELERTVSQDRLEGVFTAAHSGRHGRTDGQHRSHGVWETHRQFFGRENPLALTERPVKRIVAATELGTRFQDEVDRFNSFTSSDLRVALEDEGLLNGAKANREAERLLAVLDSLQPSSPVEAFRISVS